MTGDEESLPAAGPAAERLLAFVSWFGDGDIGEYFPAWPPLESRDIEAVCTALRELSKGQGKWTRT